MRSEPLTGSDSLFITGNNQSDDLFMFFKRRVTGLQPNGRYRVTFALEFVTNVRVAAAASAARRGRGCW